MAAQATVGTLVAKTLTTTSQNPYQGGRAAASSAAPAALDAFSIQVRTCPPAPVSATAHAVRQRDLSRCLRTARQVAGCLATTSIAPLYLQPGAIIRPGLGAAALLRR